MQKVGSPKKYHQGPCGLNLKSKEKLKNLVQNNLNLLFIIFLKTDKYFDSMIIFELDNQI